MPIVDSIKKSFHSLIGKVELDIESDPSETYEHLEYGTRLDDLLLLPLLVTAYLPMILPLIGVSLPASLDIWVLIGGIGGFVIGSMVKTTWLASRVQEKSFLKTTVRFPRGKTKVIQWEFSKDSNDSTVYRMDLDKYALLKSANGEAVPSLDEENKAKWIPYIFDRKPHSAIVLLPFTIGQLDFKSKDVVEAGQTTRGARAEGTLYFLQRATLASPSGVEPMLFDIFKIVESQVHYEKEEVVQNLTAQQALDSVKDIDRGLSVPLTSIVNNQAITIKNLEEQLNDAVWNARKESNKRLKDILSALNLVQPKTEIRDDWIQWVVILGIVIVVAFFLGAYIGMW